MLEQTKNNKRCRDRYLLRLALTAPLLAGLLWTFCHPIVSIVTGEFKCRGIYIDEHALDPLHFFTDSYPTSFQNTVLSDDNLCKKLNLERQEWRGPSTVASSTSKHTWEITDSRFSCYSTASFDIIKILPRHSMPVSLPTEAIAIVLSPNWKQNHLKRADGDTWFHLFQHLVQRLRNSAWLAKTILIIVPSIPNDSFDKHTQAAELMKQTVDKFIQAYLLDDALPLNLEDNTITSFLPPSYTMFLLRQLIVVDLHEEDNMANVTTSSCTKLEFLPQGTRGLLPNLDLVFASVESFRTIRYHDRSRPVKESIHSHDMTWWEKRVIQSWWPWKEIGSWGYQWGLELGDLGAYIATMALGPHGSHSPALENGIDSMTIRISGIPASTMPSKGRSSIRVNQGTSATMSIHPHYAQVFQSIEHLTRALSNLHERLHHSVTLYLLPSPSKFVSQGEYIYPMVLILLPLVVRAASLLLIDIQYFDCKVSVLLSVLVTFVSWALFTIVPCFDQEACENSTCKPTTHALLVVLALYVVLVALSERIKNTPSHVHNDQRRQSIQFIACLAAIYLHAPLALAHVSLAYPSAVIWSICLALPNYKTRKTHVEFRWIQSVIRLIPVVVMSPSTLLIPRIFQHYSAYVCLVYIPLHFYLTILLIW